MMGSPTTLRIGSPLGTQAPAATGESPGAPGNEFLSMLVAAGGKTRETAAATAEAELPEAAEDPAMAALLSAMLPGHTPPSTQDPAGSTADAGAALEQGGQLDATALEAMLEGSRMPDQAARAIDEAATSQLARAMNDAMAGEGDADLLPQLARELAGSMREAAPGLRAPANMESHSGISLANGLAAPATGTPAAGTASAPEHALRTPVGSPRWADELGSRLVMLSTRGQHEGSLTLAPEHLGPLEVRISMQQNTAHVWFGAQQADTRAALAEALPRLRELFADAGLSLGQAGVSQDAPRRDSPEAVPGRTSSLGEDADVAHIQGPQSSLRRTVSGLLDLYA